MEKLRFFLNHHSATILSIALAILIAVIIYLHHEIVPEYFFNLNQSNVAARTMITNTAGLLALLTFATGNASNISKKDSDTYLGEDINSFILLQAPHSKTISGRTFKCGVICLVVLPIIAFEYPKFLYCISASWWGLFVAITLLLIWNLVSALTAFGTNAFRPKHVLKKIESHQQKKWHTSVKEAIGNRKSDPFYVNLMHSNYLEELENVKAEDRAKYIEITLGDLQIFDGAIREVGKYFSDPKSVEYMPGELYGFIAGRQNALITRLQATNDPATQEKLFKLICDTDSIYWKYKATIDFAVRRHISVIQKRIKPTCSENQVPRTSLFAVGTLEASGTDGAVDSATITDLVELIPAIVYHQLSQGISEGQIKPTANEVSDLIDSINRIEHLGTKKYAVKQLVEAIITAAIIDRTADQQLPSDISEISPYLIPEASIVDDDEKIWKECLTNISEMILTSETDLPIEAQDTLLNLTSAEFRFAYLFSTLFKTAAVSHSENIEILKCLAQKIDPINFSERQVGNGDESLGWDFNDDDRLFINLETTKEKIKALASNNLLSHIMRFRSDGAFNWTFDILDEPVKYALYRDFKNKSYMVHFEFCTLILWRALTSSPLFGKELPAPLAWVFFEDEIDTPSDSEEAIQEITSTADLLEQLGRTEEATLLYRSVEMN